MPFEAAAPIISDVARFAADPRVFAERAPCLWRRVALLVLALCAFAGCTDAVPTVSPPPELTHAIEVREQLGLQSDLRWVMAVESDPNAVLREGIRVTIAEAASLDEERVLEEIQLRTQFHLVADRSWVMAVIADPRSVIRNPAVPILMSPEEAAAWDARATARSDIRRVLNGYVGPYQAQSGGWYFVDDGGNAIALFTSNIEAHRAALAALVAPSAGNVEARAVRWTLDELRAFRDQVFDQEGWFEGRGVRLTGAEEDVPTNRVVVDLEVDNPHANSGLAAAVLRNWSAQEWMTIRTSIDAMRWLGTGSLTVSVIDTAGSPVPDITCQLLPVVSGAAGDFSISESDGEGLCVWDGASQIGATVYEIQVRRRLDGPAVGAATVEVPRDGSAHVVVQVPL